MHQGQRSWIYASFIPASYTHASGSRIIGICIIHMGQFLQGGKNGCFVSLFFFTESLRVAKPCKIKLIFRLILVDWVFRIVETSRPSLGKNFGVPCGTPVLALLSDFWVKIRALVRPSLQGWTGFDLLIISGVKF